MLWDRKYRSIAALSIVGKDVDGLHVIGCKPRAATVTPNDNHHIAAATMKGTGRIEGCVMDAWGLGFCLAAAIYKSVGHGDSPSISKFMFSMLLYSYTAISLFIL
jgi:hypothetical protein